MIDINSKQSTEHDKDIIETVRLEQYGSYRVKVHKDTGMFLVML